jgi:hypothetical protein
MCGEPAAGGMHENGIRVDSAEGGRRSGEGTQLKFGVMAFSTL